MPRDLKQSDDSKNPNRILFICSKMRMRKLEKKKDEKEKVRRGGRAFVGISWRACISE